MKPNRIHIIGDDYPTEEKPIGDLIKKVMAEGGYLAGWNDARYFHPKDLEDVLVHLKNNGRYDWQNGRYMDNGEYQQIYFDEHYSVAFADVDFWMHIPPVPERED